jgi:hypothetical protein
MDGFSGKHVTKFFIIFSFFYFNLLDWGNKKKKNKKILLICKSFIAYHHLRSFGVG